MTYFFLFAIAIMALVILLSAIRVGVLEERIAMIERDHHALASKGDRLRKSRLWQPLDYEDIDYD